MTKAQQERQDALRDIYANLSAARRDITYARTIALHFGIDIEIPKETTLDAAIERTVKAFEQPVEAANG